VNEAGKILSEVSEAILSKKENDKVILVNVAKAYPTDRDAVHVIKDAVHIDDLPKMTSIQIAGSAADFAEWYSLVSNSGFTLKNKRKFVNTKRLWEKQYIYECLETGRFWYPDYFHKDNRKHYEIFDHKGKHLGEADENGLLQDGTSDPCKSIREILQ
jgi:hypothetical protein